MHQVPVSDHGAAQARTAGREDLAAALQASRRDTLATFAAYVVALGPDLTVPCRSELNPPLWELGHVGWFQEFWTTRNPEQARGWDADPDAPRPEGVRRGAEALYHSSQVAHATRWGLPLPDADATRADLRAQLDAALAQLARAGDDDRSLYFHRLALFHEDMHHEAALYMARGLGIAIDDARWLAPRLSGARDELAFERVSHRMAPDARGFHFDNEAPGCTVDLAPYRIDGCVLSWAEYLPFVEAGGYADARWWTDAGNRWRQGGGATAPRYLRLHEGRWQRAGARGWQPLDPGHAAEHLTLHEAEAWCRWAGRRLPTEAEWEHAALHDPARFAWGTVWEWTASPFTPFEGFVPHPYRDYSRPWFDGRPVLRGASYLTQPRLRHRRYRNFFGAERNDIVAGFRTCAA